jgi:hypothetical protein
LTGPSFLLPVEREAGLKNFFQLFGIKHFIFATLFSNDQMLMWKNEMLGFAM